LAFPKPVDGVEAYSRRVNARRIRAVWGISRAGNPPFHDESRFFIPRGKSCLYSARITTAMSEDVRHRVVHAISFSLLQKEVKKLRAQGWIADGEPALAAPMDETKPPYWVQTMYLPTGRRDSGPSDPASSSS
jgi:hypothetical protein